MAELIDEADLQAWQAFLAAHAGVVARIEAALAERSLVPLEWYDVLVAIQLAPGHRLRMRDVAAQLLLTRSNATRLVDRLEAAGLIERRPNAGDQRGADAVLTAAGRAALRRAWPVYAAGIHDHFLSKLRKHERATLGDLLRRLSESAAPAPARPRRATPPGRRARPSS